MPHAQAQAQQERAYHKDLGTAVRRGPWQRPQYHRSPAKSLCFLSAWGAFVSSASLQVIAADLLAFWLSWSFCHLCKRLPGHTHVAQVVAGRWACSELWESTVCSREVLTSGAYAGVGIPFWPTIIKEIVVGCPLSSTLLSSGNLHLRPLQRLAKAEWLQRQEWRRQLAFSSCARSTSSVSSAFLFHSTCGIHCFPFLKLILGCWKMQHWRIFGRKTERLSHDFSNSPTVKIPDSKVIGVNLGIANCCL